MTIHFTPEQQRVIELHNRNILVSAAAGSGKTAVLVERIVKMVCDEKKPVDIDRLLIVTFTNAAAAEMRERISDGIAARLQLNPENEHIQKQATLLHNAQITTIDSFSLFLIRNHFNEIGLDPAFRVADEGEIKLLQQEILQELLEECFAEGTESFHYCVEYFCPGGRESVLEQHILNLSRYAGSFPWPEEWLKQRKQDYEADSVAQMLGSVYGRYLEKHIEKMLAGCVEKMEEVRRICESPDGPYMYGELVDAEIETFQKLSGKNLEEAARMIPAITFGRLPAKKDDTVSPDKRELAKGLRSEVKETVQKLSECFFATPLELAAKQGRACAKPVETLINLVLEFNRRMQEKKQERKLIDFSDMEHYALDILLDREDGKESPSAVAKEYRQHFHEILIDEYQDSNLVQESLLRAISGEEDGHYNRFMVGDVKQSIYKFRLARPELFLEKYDTYEEDGDCTRIDLAKNFRSRTQVVEAVNDIFSRVMSKECGEIEYDERAALYAGATYPENKGCETELLLIEKPGKEERINAKQAEAMVIAEKIKELRTSFLVYDKTSGGMRPVRFGDMVILLRSNSGWDEEFKRVLEEAGIPAYITSKTGYFGATEVQELLQLLRVLDNPRQDIPLYGVMKSVFGNFTEEEIAEISAWKKQRNNGCSLYETLCEYASGESEQDLLWKKELAGRVEHFLEAIREYRSYTAYMPIRELLQRLVDDFDYLNYVTALPAGGKRRANVEMLFTKASDFEKSSYFGLFHFIRYIEQLEKYDVDYGEADILDENADVVRIMSIHKSKGLEFPVTFVAGLSKRFNMQDASQSLIVDMDMGLATDYVNPEKRIRNKTLRRMVLARKMKEDNLAEELRVLYVALTRAKEKLIMTATLEKAEEKWSLSKLQEKQALGYLGFMEAGSYLDFLLPILPQTCVQVSIRDVAELSCEKLREQIQLMERKRMLQEAEIHGNCQELQRLQEQFRYVYPHQKLQRLYTKTTVSELKIAAMVQKDENAYHAFEEKEILPYIPAFRREKEEVSGTVRGNAFHRVMELLDFDGLLRTQFSQIPVSYELYRQELDEESLLSKLQEFLQNEVKHLRLTEEYYKAVKVQKIMHFLQSELFLRMWRAARKGQLYREQPFVLGIEATRLGEEFPEKEKVLIQGIIDAFFVEDGQIVLLDYKTDVITSMDALWNRYATQMDYYEEALRKLMGMDVKERVLYSFYLERY